MSATNKFSALSNVTSLAYTVWLHFYGYVNSGCSFSFIIDTPESKHVKATFSDALQTDKCCADLKMFTVCKRVPSPVYTDIFGSPCVETSMLSLFATAKQLLSESFAVNILVVFMDFVFNL